jgi:ABC-type uncharacterized transport system permease subunit
MPTISRLYVRTAFAYLVVGTPFGSVVLWNKGSPLGSAWRLLEPHIQTLTLGWLLLLTMGVAFWILPRFGYARRRVGLVVAVYALLNASIWLGVTAALLPSGTLGALAGVLSAGACALFAAHAWPRVKPAASASGR